MEAASTNSKRSVVVTVDYKPNASPVYVTEWTSNGYPIKENKLEGKAETEDGQIKFDCTDKTTKILYVGEQFTPKFEKYMILVVEDEKATLKPCTYFCMRPKLDLPNRTGKISTLSYTEQMDEINEKFGSKRSIRRIEERKKNMVAYGAEDYQAMKEKVDAMQLDPVDGPDDKKADNGSYIDPFLMPPRNDTANNVEEVYKLIDIIPQSLVESIKVSNNWDDIKPALASDLVKHFATKARDDSEKACCFFLDALIKFKRLKPTEIGKVESGGIDGVNCSNLVSTIIQNYSISTIKLGKPRRTLDEKCKDKIIIHAIILCVMLNNYKPLLISALAQAFQTSVIKIKKFGNVVGCHVEMNTTKTERLLVLKIPLYTMENENKFKRRKVR